MFSSSAKRYERMMKAHGIHQSSQPIRETTIASRPPKRAESASTPKDKKRKLDQFTDANSNTDTGDDDEGLQNIKPEPVKSEPVGTVVKEEPVELDQNPLSFSPGTMESEYQPDESSFFNEFLHPGAFDQPALNGQSAYGGGFEPEGFGGLGTVSTSGSGNGEAIHDSILIAD